MIQRMEECGPQLSLERIRHIESSMGIAFPEEYESFLLKYNGGRPTPNAYPIEGLANNPFGVIQIFFGIDDPVESCNLDWNYEVHKEHIPSNLLPIACDDGGDLICVSLSGDAAGVVLFWDRHVDSDKPSYESMYRIASTFSEFVNGIREAPA